MDLDKTLNDALNYTKKMFDDVGKLLILIVLNVIPIVNFVVLGYAAKVLRTSPKANKPPRLEKYIDMWIQGLKIVVVTFIYMIIPFLIFGAGITSVFFGIFGAGFGGFMGPEAWKKGPSAWSNIEMMGSPAFIGFGALLIIIGVVAIFILLLIHLIGVSNMVKKDSFGKAFAFGEIFNIIGKIGWGSYILLLIIMFVLLIIISGIGSIPRIGWLIAAIISPLFMVFLGRALGSIYETGIKSRSRRK